MRPVRGWGRFGRSRAFSRRPPWSTREVASADVVVLDGRLFKNRFGAIGGPAPFDLPNGCYRLVRIDSKAAAA